MADIRAIEEKVQKDLEDQRKNGQVGSYYVVSFSISSIFVSNCNTAVVFSITSN